ncbi:hypothetical protein [Streptomyces mayteni]
MSASDRREPGEVFGPRMTLFADMLAVGLVTTLASLPLVTAPAAFSTASAVLRGAGEDRPATAGRYLRLLRRRRRLGDLAAGAVALAGALLIVADLALVRAGLPGGPAVGLAVAAVAAGAVVVGLRSCGRPESVTDWRAAVRGAAGDTVRDVGGSALVLLALATAVLCGWMMLPLALLVPGPLALALAAVDVRARRYAALPAGR